MVGRDLNNEKETNGKINNTYLKQNNENNKKITQNHNVLLENCSKMTITAVKEVISAQNTAIIAKTDAGIVTISGTNLRVARLALEEGLLIVEGTVVAFKYSGSITKKNFFARLFK